MSDDEAHRRRLDDAAAVLRAWVAQQYDEDRLATTPGTAEDRVAEVMHRLRADPAWDGQLPTEEVLLERIRLDMAGEQPGRSPYLEGLVGELREGAVRALGGQPAGAPVVALLARTPFFFARTQEDTGVDDAYLVLLHHRFPLYLDLVARSIAAVVPIGWFVERPSAHEMTWVIENRMHSEPDRTVRTFAEAAVSLAEMRTDVTGGSYPVAPERYAHFTLLLDAALMFVLGHEMAHYEMSHDGPPRPAVERLGFARAPTRAWQELQADELGASIAAWTLRTGRGIPLGVSMLGAWQFFLAWEAFDLSVHVLATGDAEAGFGRFFLEQENAGTDGAYPSISMRRSTLEATVARAAPGDAGLEYFSRTFDLIRQRFLRDTAFHAEHMAAVGPAGRPPTGGHGPGFA
ncbi:hypothetical protein [Cellulomonas marina]|uniref:Uncharacterized protein n=1 Tax=Cellulomonas marina TaxID=988821 RepID=A0A1I0Y520_9CELL|nr:hypothetical protein [Cellulomonas marina]GIG29807.1 hypothetical protein Cma02nite_24070 [Cellulomonas marina]SFB08505.1 hypothetical protein SAMN05421867_106190 [Cellulomonas marina]